MKVTGPHDFDFWLIFDVDSDGQVQIPKFKLFRFYRNKVWNGPSTLFRSLTCYIMKAEGRYILKNSHLNVFWWYFVNQWINWWPVIFYIRMDQKWRHYLVFIVSIHPRLIQEINCSPKLVMRPEVQVEKFYGPLIRLF